MILVTGGTGLVGSHLLYRLTRDNASVRAIYRNSHKLEAVKKMFSYYSEDVETLYNRIEWVEADVNDIPALSEAFKNVTYVYHCAAFVSFEPDKYHQLRKINIEGTANVVNLCISNTIQKICYVSSIAAIGNETNPEKFITEKTGWNPEADHSVYAITKYGAEIEVWRGTQEGVDAVIINPGVIVGPSFWKSGGSGSFFQKIYKGFPYYTDGMTGYVDVGDVIEIMVQLMESDIKNEAFIVISENLSFKEFLSKVAKSMGMKPPHKKAGKLLLKLGWRLDWLQHKLQGKRRRLSKQMAQTAQTKTMYDASKIKNALNFTYRPMDASITSVGQYFLEDVKNQRV
ncbi:MAG TPA: NAD-dependent epimerase/dehydratase family protein [Aquaticitalea sp.]|nr:NAD-dependent epimerase/dehydratase family protein [Aquaticitalea sp.]